MTEASKSAAFPTTQWSRVVAAGDAAAPRPVPRSRNCALDRVLDLLADDYAQSGRADVFDRLKVVLSGGKGAVPVAELAAELGMTESAVYTAVHRLKKRYRAILRREIAATLDDPSEVDEEIRWLFEAIRS